MTGTPRTCFKYATMTRKPYQRRARYVSPSDNECADMLTPAEFALAGTERLCVLRARAKAWEHHRQTGPLGRIRALAERGVGAYVVLPEYDSTMQVGPLLAMAKKAERAKFSSKLERSLVDGSIVGVRVTLVGFDE